MKSLKELLRGAIATLYLACICCGLYPLAVWGVAQGVFGDKANGSLITDNAGTVRGSSLIGQSFSGTNYFHPRPSAAGSGYDAASSSGSNLGPTSQKLRDAIRERTAAYRAENALVDNQPIPADAVTASASGLDPHVSPQNAELQISRIARARSMDEEAVRSLVQRNTEGPDFGILGDPAVNVLLLNLALDAESTRRSP